MPRRLTTVLAATAAIAALTLSGCSATADDETGSDTAADGSFPVTIEHAFGDTTIDAEPTRVVTWGWGSADDAIALGVVPVAIPFQAYGGDENGVLPWISEALDEQGEELPTVLSDSTEPPYEEIAEAAPDVILAAYSGLTEEQYELLSAIAPVVAYPDEPWSTDWRELIEITGTALGRSDEATTLLADIDDTIAEKAAAHPEFDGKTVALTSDSGGVFYVYTDADPRVTFATELGFESAPSVAELANGESAFFYTLSYEQLDQLESDVIVNFGATQEESDAFLNAGYAQVMPQVQNGAVASPVGAAFVSSVSPPTGLSLTWGIDDYVDLLSTAALAADAAE
ncbi:iron-siderophore ABC transporter substrate-binding protein [Cryobacterium sp. 1639]|uniref:iron-siderophore ABC transporter substrate-binding protein n=1 Tax=Cryobacterium inferilacus TaxID=2866629 RepID=UPI001C72DE14|nr:iron-siderophore ABC transporter substrate-binding protein [Cryobacterium sp. 1639]MBX0301345.1 iron-siderophore ABC transporter substrate-binding protein [Cryobacterium sp. 1639]